MKKHKIQKYVEIKQYDLIYFNNILLNNQLVKEVIKSKLKIL